MKRYFYLLCFLFAGCDDIRFGSDPEKYSQELFTFYGYNDLTHDHNISAKKVIFEQGSITILNKFNLRIHAKEIIFKQGSKVLGYLDENYNGCLKNGNNAGNLYLLADKVGGESEITLHGQRPGKNGTFYYLKNNKNKFYHDSDRHRIKKSRFGEYVENECETTIAVDNSEYKEKWSHLHFMRGNAGKIFYDETTDRTNFSYKTIILDIPETYNFSVWVKSGNLNIVQNLYVTLSTQETNECRIRKNFENCEEE